jgi:hypothetical protein
MTVSSYDLDLVPASLVTQPEGQFALRVRGSERDLVIAASGAANWLDQFEGERLESNGRTLVIGPRSPRNASALRKHLPWLVPAPLGLRTSAGLGDRLGLATPGHIRAVRAVGGRIAPVFAQQSIREMTRTGRSPQGVMDDALWGVFGEGWRDGFGADADHLKTTADIDACVAAGFTFFTIDPGEWVDGAADRASTREVDAAIDRLPWDVLEASRASVFRRFADRTFDIDDFAVQLDAETLARAAAKYGRAVAHVVRMYRHLVAVMADRPFELEVSVDETDTPTTHAQHYYIAAELTRLSVAWVSLAPRFVGRFEKGVDYIGDLAEFERDVARHAAIARELGPYKLSLHSGSDKFSIYPIAARHTRGLVHLKTAGTSYLEALRTVASADPRLFREIYAFAREHYERDRATYHVSAALSRAPAADAPSATDLAGLLDQFDAREILHVTFGSVLTDTISGGERRFYGRVMEVLHSHPDAYAANLEAHFIRHLRPFSTPGTKH